MASREFHGRSQFLNFPIFAVIFSACCVSYACCSDDFVTLIVSNRIDKVENLTISFSTLNHTSNETIDIETLEAVDVAPFEKVNVSLPNGTGLNIWLVQVHVALQDNQTLILMTEFSPSSNLLHLVVYGDNTSGLFTWVGPKPIKPPIGIDQALLVIRNNGTTSLKIRERSENCFKCTYVDTGVSFPGIKLFVLVDTKFAMNYQIYNDNGIIVTNISQFLFDEGKRYIMTLSQDHITLPTTTDVGSHYLYLLPILYAAIVLIGTFAVWLIGNFIYLLVIN
jgi:hypothetical protein